MGLYAGVDRDGVVKLFMEEHGHYYHIHHKEWLDLTEGLDLQPGEMPKVSLTRNAPGYETEAWQTIHYGPETVGTMTRQEPCG